MNIFHLLLYYIYVISLIYECQFLHTFTGYLLEKVMVPDIASRVKRKRRNVLLVGLTYLFVFFFICLNRKRKQPRWSHNSH